MSKLKIIDEYDCFDTDIDEDFFYGERARKLALSFRRRLTYECSSGIPEDAEQPNDGGE